MFFGKKKKEKVVNKFILSENAISFIKNHACPQLKISSPIDEEMLDKITKLATLWELDMIDPLSKDGCDKTYDYPEKKRNELADKFVGEITGQWDDEKLIPDLEDLNKKLGLI